MNVQTSVTVTRAMIENHEDRRRLVNEARNRLAELGLATSEQLDDDPSITVSAEPEIAGAAVPWVHVTFTWELST